MNTTAIQTYVALLAVWFLLAGVNSQTIAFGMFSCFIIVYSTGAKIFNKGVLCKLHLKRLFWFLRHLPYYIWAEIMSHLLVLRMIYLGGIKPEIIEVPLHTREDLTITATGNSVTMTPGTLTLVADQNKLWIHTIDSDQDVVAVTKKFEQNFEGMLE
ncbi:MAG: Na+/H+ antiporter subunit E [archaeon]